MNLFEEMNNHPDVRVKDLGNGLFSCNFTRDAFFSNRWDSTSTKARGLFINEVGKIFGRGYDKFFDYNPETDEELLKNLTRASLKINGYLLLVFAYQGELQFYTKAGKSIFADNGERILRALAFDKSVFDDLLEYCEGENVTIAFEILDQKDPHMVKRDEDGSGLGYGASLIGVIKNEEVFTKGNIDEVASILTKKMGDGFSVATEINLGALPNDLALDLIFTFMKNSTEEGLVVEAGGKMLKFKTDYYRSAKTLRRFLMRARKNGDFENVPTEWETLYPKVWHYLRNGGNIEDFIVSNPGGQDSLMVPELIEESEKDWNK